MERKLRAKASGQRAHRMQDSSVLGQGRHLRNQRVGLGADALPLALRVDPHLLHVLRAQRPQFRAVAAAGVRVRGWQWGQQQPTAAEAKGALRWREKVSSRQEE